MELKRRTFLAGAAGLATAPLLARRVWAATELTFGDMTLTTLSDGYLTQPPDFRYLTMPPFELSDWLAEQGIARDANITPPCNITLLRHQDRLVLFDAGSGSGFLPTVGELPDALDAAGVDPGEVTHVVFTHGHADHLWGVLDDFDDPLFPDALHMMGWNEFDFWSNPETVNNVSADRVQMAVGAARRLEVIGDQLTLFSDGEEIIPGIAARATPGHTPGHMSFELRSGSQSVMVVGDAILNESFSCAHPEWRDGADQDRKLAVTTRMGLLDQLAGEQMPMIGFHFAGGGIGHIERAGGAFRFVPA